MNFLKIALLVFLALLCSSCYATVPLGYSDTYYGNYGYYDPYYYTSPRSYYYTPPRSYYSGPRLDFYYSYPGRQDFGHYKGFGSYGRKGFGHYGRKGFGNYGRKGFGHGGFYGRGYGRGFHR